MKVKLEFQLPEEREDYELHMKASKMYQVLWEFREYLHRKYKHECPSSDEAEKEYEEIKEKLWEICDEYEFNM